MVAVVAKLPQQVVQSLAFGDKHRGTQQGTNIQLRGALQFEQVLRHQNANDVFTVALVHWEAGMRRLNHLVQQLVKGRINRQQVHAGRGHHDIAGGHVGHADHAFEHESAFAVDDVVMLGISECGDQFIRRVGAGMNKFGEFLQERAFVSTFGMARKVRV